MTNTTQIAVKNTVATNLPASPMGGQLMAEGRMVKTMQRKRDEIARSIDALLFSACEHKSWYS